MDLKNGLPVLFVKDARKSRDFYVNVLKMNVILNSGDLNFVFREGLAIWQIMEQNKIPQKLGMDKITDKNVPSRFEICFETESIDDVYQKLKEHQVTFLHEMNTELWGQRTIRFYDPDGHLLEVGEAMPVFLSRIYNEEGKNLESTAKRTYTSPEILRQFLKL